MIDNKTKTLKANYFYSKKNAFYIYFEKSCYLKLLKNHFRKNITTLFQLDSLALIELIQFPNQ